MSQKRETKHQLKLQRKQSKNSFSSSKEGKSQELENVEEVKVSSVTTLKDQLPQLLKKRSSSEMSDEQSTPAKAHDSLKKVNISIPQMLFLVEKPLIYNRYRFVKRLGASKGALKQVYLVRDIKNNNRLLVIKLYTKEEELVFYHEYNNNLMIGNTDSKCQVTIIGHVEQHVDMPIASLVGQDFKEYNLLVFEYHKQETVLSIIMKAAQIKHTMSDELEQHLQFGVTYALYELLRKTGLCHLDVKGDNFILDLQNIVKLIDFGAAHKYNQTPNKDIPIGTPQYAPPEYLLKQSFSNQKFDVFGLAVLLCHIRYRTVLFKFAHPSDETYRLIHNGDFETFFKNLSGSRSRNHLFEKLIQCCLSRATQRLTLEQIVTHDYFITIRKQGMNLSAAAKAELAMLQSIKLRE
eukprot:403368287